MQNEEETQSKPPSSSSSLMERGGGDSFSPVKKESEEKEVEQGKGIATEPGEDSTKQSNLSWSFLYHMDNTPHSIKQ